MNRKSRTALATAALSVTGMIPTLGYGFTFDASEGSIQGSFDSTITVGFARRMASPSCSLVGDAGVCGDSANTAQWSAGDNGNLNYKKGDFFAAYLKGTHELYLRKPDSGLKFMLRGSWMEDFKADDTRRTELSSDAKAQIVRDRRLLDFWVSKDFKIGDNDARVRLGNQVISWGESIFAIGGIDSINALDIQRLMVPGTQLKEAVLPAPMISLATALGRGFNVEGFYQFRWNRSRMAPVGGYFSAADYYDKGREPVSFSGANYNVTGTDPAALLGRRKFSAQEAIAAIEANGDFAVPILGDKTPRNDGQFGVALHYKPEGGDFDFGFYFLNYHDKTPVLNLVQGGDRTLGGGYQWEFRQNRQLYGVSLNTQLGNWAVGSELSYRPKDAVALSGCFNAGGPLDSNTNGAVVSNCPMWKDNEKYQLHVTAMLQLMPSEHGWALDALGADGGFLTFEAVMIKYPGISPNKRITRTIDGVQVDQVPMAAYLTFLDRSDPNNPIAAGGGTENSWGYVADLNWTYDGKLIPGWQVTPGVTFSHSVKGDTPNYMGNYLEGAKAINFYVLFNQNPATWQAGINYTNYFGGKSDPARQYFKDRDFLGMFVSRNF